MMQAITKAVLALLAAFLIAVPAHAGSSDKIKVTIDRTFRVGDVDMPAGDYTIRLLNNGSDNRMLVFETAEMRVFAAAWRVMTSPGVLEDNTEIVFTPGEQGLQAREIRIAGQPYRYQLQSAR